MAPRIKSMTNNRKYNDDNKYLCNEIKYDVD